MDALEAKGSCLCGAVGFTVRLPTKGVAHCHCTRCRRAHGAAFVTWVGNRSDDVTLADPEHTLRWYVAAEGGQRGFCGRCGSPMFFRADRWPGELHIARALFHEPVRLDPQAHAYNDTRVDWVTLGDHLRVVPTPT